MARWSIRFTPDIILDSEIVSRITKIKTYIEIIKDIPIGQGQRNDLLEEGFRPSSIDGGTLRDDIVLKDIKGTAAIEGNVLNDTEINNVLKYENARNIQETEILNMKMVRKYIEGIQELNDKVIITEDFN